MMANPQGVDLLETLKLETLGLDSVFHDASFDKKTFWRADTLNTGQSRG